MPSIEKEGDGMYNATFYESLTTTAAGWTRIGFTDYDGNEFPSEYIRLKATTAAMNFSFDPRNVGASRVVQGVVAVDEVVVLHHKRATEIWVSRVAGDGTIEVTAWR